MFNPVVLPLPLALAVIAALCLLAAGVDTRPLVIRPAAGRHRLSTAAAPYRPSPRPPVNPTRPAAARTDRAGYTMWSWSDAADTSEMAAIR